MVLVVELHRRGLDRDGRVAVDEGDALADLVGLGSVRARRAEGDDGGDEDEGEDEVVVVGEHLEPAFLFLTYNRNDCRQTKTASRWNSPLLSLIVEEQRLSRYFSLTNNHNIYCTFCQAN